MYYLTWLYWLILVQGKEKTKMKVLVYNKHYDFINATILSENNITDFSFTHSDNYNENKFYIVKRDKNRHYYLQEFINFKPVTKVTRLHKNFIESVLNIDIIIRR